MSVNNSNKPVFLGYLCPVCVVRFPYAEELAKHWTYFHIGYRYGGKELKSCPSLAHAARKRRSTRNTYPQKADKVRCVLFCPKFISVSFVHRVKIELERKERTAKFQDFLVTRLNFYVRSAARKERWYPHCRSRWKFLGLNGVDSTGLSIIAIVKVTRKRYC